MPSDRWTWEDVIDWVVRMGRKFGGTVWERGGKDWDWGQALCRDVYGPDWSKSAAFKADDGLSVPPPALVEAARRWEAGQWPTWAHKPEEDADAKQ